MKATGRTNMMVIILDAMREDSVLPGLAEPGRCFKAQNCIASSPWTLPSVTSLLTGVDSRRHRHFWHSGDLAEKGLTRSLPRSFQKIGVVNNKVMQRSSQLDDGFDKWTYFLDHADPFDHAAPLVRDARPRKKPLFLLLHSNISHDYFRPEASAWFDEIFPDESRGRVHAGRSGDSMEWHDGRRSRICGQDLSGFGDEGGVASASRFSSWPGRGTTSSASWWPIMVRVSTTTAPACTTGGACTTT